MVLVSYEEVELEFSTPAIRYLNQKRSELCRATWILARSFNQSEPGLEINHGILYLVNSKRTPSLLQEHMQPGDFVCVRC